MSSAYTLAKQVIKLHKKTKAYCENMVDVYFAAGRLSDEEYTELVSLIESEYED